MEKRKLRILMIDDRPVRRQRVSARLKKDHNLEVVGQLSCLSNISTDLYDAPPNVIVISNEVAKRCHTKSARGLDQFSEQVALELPIMNSIRQLTAHSEIPIIQYGDNTEIDALIGEIKSSTSTGIKASIRHSSLRSRRASILLPIITIGASTGGVDALASVLSKFSANCPPTLIVQHMKPTFTAGFAARLNGICPAEVSEATDKAMLKPGKVYVAPGGQHMEIVRGGGGLRCSIFKGEQHSGHMPSVDVLFQSLSKLRGPRIAVLLTGMGRDGAEGMMRVKQSGGTTIVQDEKSSIVYGMPRVAMEIGAAGIQLPLRNIGDEVMRISKSLTTITNRSRVS